MIQKMIAPFLIGAAIGVAAGVVIMPHLDSEFKEKMLCKGKRAWHQVQESVENML